MDSTNVFKDLASFVEQVKLFLLTKGVNYLAGDDELFSKLRKRHSCFDQACFQYHQIFKMAWSDEAGIR